MTQTIQVLIGEDSEMMTFTIEDSILNYDIASIEIPDWMGGCDGTVASLQEVKRQWIALRNSFEGTLDNPHNHVFMSSSHRFEFEGNNEGGDPQITCYREQMIKGKILMMKSTTVVHRIVTPADRANESVTECSIAFPTVHMGNIISQVLEHIQAMIDARIEDDDCHNTFCVYSRDATRRGKTVDKKYERVIRDMSPDVRSVFRSWLEADDEKRVRISEFIKNMTD